MQVWILELPPQYTNLGLRNQPKKMGLDLPCKFTSTTHGTASCWDELIDKHDKAMRKPEMHWEMQRMLQSARTCGTNSKHLKCHPGAEGACGICVALRAEQWGQLPGSRVWRHTHKKGLFHTQSQSVPWKKASQPKARKSQAEVAHGSRLWSGWPQASAPTLGLWDFRILDLWMLCFLTTTLSSQ